MFFANSRLTFLARHGIHQLDQAGGLRNAVGVRLEAVAVGILDRGDVPFQRIAFLVGRPELGDLPLGRFQDQADVAQASFEALVVHRLDSAVARFAVSATAKWISLRMSSSSLACKSIDALSGSADGLMKAGGFAFRS